MREQDSKKLAAARLRALDRCPYWANVIHGMVPVPTDKVPTLAVDMYWRLYYNPAYLEGLPVEEAAGAIVHECGHLFRGHHERCADGGFEPTRYNVAGDLAINDDIPPKSDLRLPAGVLYPQTFGLPEGRTEEFYYQNLPAEVGQNQGSSSSSTAGSGPASGNSGSQGSQSSPGGQQSGGQKHGPGSGHCGSCATGKPESYESPPPGNPSAVRGVSKQQSDSIRRATAADIERYASEHPGSVPDTLLRDVKEVRSPQVPWRQELGAQIRSAITQVVGRADRSYRRINRRRPELPGGILLPGRKDDLCEVVVVVDTSGSVLDEMLSQVLGEIDAILKAQDNKVAVRVLATDAAVNTTQRVMSTRQVELVGGGGTDMGEGIAAAQRLNPRADLIVCFTDGYTDWPAECPGTAPVTVVLLSETGEGPAWSRNIRITPFRQSLSATG